MRTLREIGTPLLFSLSLALIAAGCGVTQGTVPPSNPTSPTGPPPIATSSGSISIAPQYVALGPAEKTHFTASSSTGGSIEWLVDGVQGGNASVGTIDSSGNYTAPGSTPLSENVTITAALAASPQQNYATAIASVINYGVIYPTANPQVDQYSLYLPAPGQVSVQFGQSTAYGLKTWQVPTPSNNGGQVNVYVAGMVAGKVYHMRAQVTLKDGATWNDVDHDQFATGLPLAAGTPPVTSPVTITGSGTPQPGIEMWNTILPQGDTQTFATDLQGNVIWTYSYPHPGEDLVQGVQLLPNGNFLLVISYLSSLTAPSGASPSGVLNEIREVDLVGNTVQDLTMDTLNQKLAAAGFHDSGGNPYQLKSFHHWVLALPNGHMVLLTSDEKNFNNLPGYPGTTAVEGDVLVDVDQDLNPDWVWSAFDHLDVNRHPMNFPDWTHANDLVYSADDRNLLLSIRHQNWIVKIDFDDAHGSGNILWRLGYQGDFQLLSSNGDPDNNPADWFYAQHGMSFFTPNTTGIFKLGLMDNGNDRTFSTGQYICKNGVPGSAQCYSTAPVLEINENDMTATLLSNYRPPASYYSYFGGNVEQLANGDIHIDWCAPAAGSIVQELDPTGTNVVWQGTTPKANQFRVDRLPSLYPGVQW
ncbi:MAG: aryl-sulfate sulfotransferase [Acidobacteriaceae bacterium]